MYVRQSGDGDHNDGVASGFVRYCDQVVAWGRRQVYMMFWVNLISCGKTVCADVQGHELTVLNDSTVSFKPKQTKRPDR
jgi:hypothetical protein